MDHRSIRRALAVSLAATLGIASQAGFAHTRLQTPVIAGNFAQHASTYNAVVVAHGCHDASGGVSTPVIATSIVFPDDTATVTPPGPNGTPDDYLQGPLANFIQMILSKHIFQKAEEKTDDLGNVVGLNWRSGTLPGSQRGVLPIYTGVNAIVSESCAKSVTLVVPIADICKVTTQSTIGDNANLWVPAVGSSFDGKPGDHGYNSPATLKIMRAANDPLPASCGAGVDVTITPTAAQINRDLPIPGYWPRTTRR